MIYDVAIIGGGLGGVAAALAAARNGKKVYLSEETTWIGGQVSSQGVPPDEHPYIEEFGCTSSYRKYRNSVRDYFKNNYSLTKDAQNQNHLNPGGGWVGTICHEPRISQNILETMLSQYRSSGLIDLDLESKVVSAEITNNHVIQSVVIRKNNSEKKIKAHYFIDATETGELLPLTNTEFIMGSESKIKTGELHALEEENQLDMQAVTWCFAVSLEPDGDYTIPRPDRYDHYRKHLSKFWPGSQLSWTYSQPHTLEEVEGSIEKVEGKVDLFGYRKILDNSILTNDVSEITLVNWPQNDYWMGPLFGQSKEENEFHYNEAKEISKCFLYWLQTEAGYPNLKPRGDSMGTDDGFAMRPYIRESRRIAAEFTVLESHIGVEMRKSHLAEPFHDSVGIGHYHLDLHPSTGGRNYVDMESCPFQIPMGAMIPVKTKNLIPGCKNIGTTHITNGCYRLHPVEWNIGESAALMSVYAIEQECTIREIYEDKNKLKEFQAFLVKEGIELSWPENLEREDIQW